MAKIKSYSTPALEKGLEILECIAKHGRPLLLAELARALNRTSSELFRMLNCLEQRGYILREESSGAYSLTLKLHELAHSHSPIEKLLRAAEIPMRSLSRQTEESCHLAGLSGGNIVILTRVESPRPLRFSIEVGARFPACRTVSGRLLLANLESDACAEVLAEDIEYKKMSASEQKKLHLKLDKIRQQGFSEAESEATQGVRDIAILIGNPKIGVMVSLAIPSLILAGYSYKPEKLLVAMKDCAAQINKKLGLTTESKVEN